MNSFYIFIRSVFSVESVNVNEKKCVLALIQLLRFGLLTKSDMKLKHISNALFQCFLFSKVANLTVLCKRNQFKIVLSNSPEGK